MEMEKFYFPILMLFDAFIIDPKKGDFFLKHWSNIQSITKIRQLGNIFERMFMTRKLDLHELEMRQKRMEFVKVGTEEFKEDVRDPVTAGCKKPEAGPQ